jgi:DNA-binding transcriptional MocR family regulator
MSRTLAPHLDLTGHWPLWAQPELGLWQRSMQRAVADVDPSMRAPLRGDGLLREALAAQLSLDPATLTVTAGVRACAAVLCRDSAGVMLERPTFLGVHRVLVASGLRVRLTAWDDKAFLSRRDHAVWFTEPVRNPDGARMDRSLLATLAGQAAAGRRVIRNATYHWFAPSADEAMATDAMVTVGSLHKIAGPGAKIGWLADRATPDDDLLRWLAMSAPPLHWQRAWGYFVRAGGLDLLRRPAATIARVRASLVAALGLADDGRAGPNLLVPLAGGETSVCATLWARGVRVVPGASFGAGEPAARICLTGLAVHDVPAVAAAFAGLVRAPDPRTGS